MAMTRKPEPQERRNDRKAKTAGKKECSESQNHRKVGMFGKPKPQERRNVRKAKATGKKEC
jgi:hypothetical protein